MEGFERRCNRLWYDRVQVRGSFLHKSMMQYSVRDLPWVSVRKHLFSNGLLNGGNKLRGFNVSRLFGIQYERVSQQMTR